MYRIKKSSIDALEVSSTPAVTKQALFKAMRTWQTKNIFVLVIAP